MTNLGVMVKLYRQRYGLTLGQLASSVGVSTATLSRIERGKSCTVATFLKLVEWLHRGEDCE